MNGDLLEIKLTVPLILNLRFPGMTLSLEVVSGQHIPRPQGADEGEVIDPYVEVNIIKGGHDQLS